MENIRAAISNNIRRYRKFNDLSADALGKLVGKSGSTITAWERGESQPDADTFILLCNVLHVNLIRICQIDMEDDEGEGVLVMQYRGMDDHGRRALLACAAALAEEFKA